MNQRGSDVGGIGGFGGITGGGITGIADGIPGVTVENPEDADADAGAKLSMRLRFEESSITTSLGAIWTTLAPFGNLSP